MSEFNWGTKKTRMAIIKAIDNWVEENEIDAGVTRIGTSTDRHDYAPAIIGVTLTPRPGVIYSINKLIQCFMKANGWDEDEAWDWYSFNTERGVDYLQPGDNPPFLVTEIDDVVNS